MSEVNVVEIYNKIEVMYNVINDIINGFYAFLGIVLALIAGVSIYLIKVGIKKVTEREAKKAVGKLLESLSKSEYIYGKEILDSSKCFNNCYEFPVLEKISFKPDIYNRVILHPIKGNKQLDYKCKVKDGRLNIEFSNFIYEDDMGVFWTIFYYPELVNLINS